MNLRLEKVWSKRPGGLLKKPSLLVCDQFKAHVTESTKRLATKLKTHLAVIPGGLTSQLQPLDVSVNKPFKGFMHEEWTKWIDVKAAENLVIIQAQRLDGHKQALQAGGENVAYNKHHHIGHAPSHLGQGKHHAHDAGMGQHKAAHAQKAYGVA